MGKKDAGLRIWSTFLRRKRKASVDYSRIRKIEWAFGLALTPWDDLIREFVQAENERDEKIIESERWWNCEYSDCEKFVQAKNELCIE